MGVGHPAERRVDGDVTGTAQSRGAWGGAGAWQLFSDDRSCIRPPETPSPGSARTPSLPTTKIGQDWLSGIFLKRENGPPL